MKKVRISVIGAGRLPEEGGVNLKTEAQRLGRLIAEAGWELVCGGLGGVMAEACRCAREAGGRTIGILPGSDRDNANEWVEVPVATGIGQMRNLMVVLNGDAVVACGGGAGTLSEIGHALKAGKPVVAIDCWDTIEGVIKADSADDALLKLKKILAGAL
ncbi:TIGR00725 family protein [Salidesulfovibrio brasiliensis]|uniref:TIGR00725 family protein n=1 Tax=Salidesulfovibrio brasiliensis TaxID=221711 RepID=UPI0006CF7B5C|nr:TIGR00725 family protein [Salidesulfovibrio brasiliensis]